MIIQLAFFFSFFLPKRDSFRLFKFRFLSCSSYFLLRGLQYSGLLQISSNTKVLQLFLSVTDTILHQVFFSIRFFSFWFPLILLVFLDSFLFSMDHPEGHSHAAGAPLGGYNPANSALKRNPFAV